jgi:hypothetical protein
MLVILFSNLAISAIGGDVRFELNPKVLYLSFLQQASSKKYNKNIQKNHTRHRIFNQQRG